MNIIEEHQNYRHFESWVAEYTQIDQETAKLPLLSLVSIYLGIFPGRTERLMTSLIQVARMWTRVWDDEKKVKELTPKIRPPHDDGGS